MSRLNKLIEKAEKSVFSRWLLNIVLSRAVPFNAPHGFKILAISKGSAQVLLPYKRSNLNHVKGIHACALATLCEFTAGITLVSMISEKEFRIILKTVSVEYFFQGKSDVKTNFYISEDFMKANILLPLSDNDAVFLKLEVPVHDIEGNHICTGNLTWQIKKWSKVKTNK